MSQRTLAERAGISAGYLAHIERGRKTELGLSIVRSLSAALQVPYEFLLAEMKGGSQGGEEENNGKVEEQLRGYSKRGAVRLLLEPDLETGSPAVEELLEGRINLHDALVNDPERTVVVRLSGESMADAGLYPGDLVVAEQGVPPSSGDIVVARVDGVLTIKRYVLENGVTMLLPQRSGYLPDVIEDPQSLQVVGIVRYSVHATGVRRHERRQEG